MIEIITRRYSRDANPSLQSHFIHRLFLTNVEVIRSLSVNALRLKIRQVLNIIRKKMG